MGLEQSSRTAVAAPVDLDRFRLRRFVEQLAATGWDDSRPQIKTLPHDVQERVNILARDRNPIAAIALVRAETGAGLVECKAYVDGEIVEAAFRGPVEITRRGKRKFVLLTAEEHDRLRPGVLAPCADSDCKSRL